jgi:creatinine amidohydrolase
MNEIRRLEEMNWPEVKAALESGVTTVVVGAGSMEQHGPHLPFQTDTLLGTALAEAVAQRLGAICGPTIPFGVSDHHMAFPGTLTLEKETFKDVVRQYVASLARHGFQNVLLLPSHGGNFVPLQELHAETGGVIEGARFIPFTNLIEFVGVLEELGKEEGIQPEVVGAHAGEGETSMVLARREDLVDMSAAAEGFVRPFDAEVARTIFEHGIVALTENGILGDARPANAERGQRYIDHLAAMLTDYFSERLPA